MTFAKIDDNFLNHTKTKRARRLGGSAAIDLWLAIRLYCGRELTDGFIPGDMLGSCGGPEHPKTVAKALGALLESGLLEVASGGYKLHDYLTWAPCKVDVLAMREAEAAKKRRQRKNVPPGLPYNTTRGLPDQVSEGLLPSRARSETDTNKIPIPIPEEPPQQQRPVPCPKGLRLSADQVGTLEVAGIPEWAVEQLTARFIAKAQAGSDVRTLEHWSKCLVMAVTGDWNDPKKRPRKTETETASDPLSGRTFVP